MRAVKSLGNGFRKRFALKIVGEHRRPRDGLQRHPVRAGRQNQRENDENFSEARQHVQPN